jgi:hypothetical protein
MVRRPIDGNVMYAPVRSTAPFEVDTAGGDDDAAAEAAVHAPTGLGGRFAPHVHAPSSSASSSASAGRNKPRVNEFVRCFGHVTTLVRRYMLFIAVVGGLVTSIAGLFLMLAGPCVLNQLKYYTITPLSLHAATKSTLNVVLLGDSLVMGSKYPVFDTVAARVRALLPHFHVTLHNLGVGGNGITAIKSRLPSVYATPADAVILLWDSDAYVLGDRETDDRLAQLQRVYESNVTYVVREIQRHKPGVKMALAGPILVGDGPWSLRYTVREYRVKAQQFDTYRDINRRLAAGTYRHDQRTWKPLFSMWHFLTKKSGPLLLLLVVLPQASTHRTWTCARRTSTPSLRTTGASATASPWTATTPRSTGPTSTRTRSASCCCSGSTAPRRQQVARDKTTSPYFAHTLTNRKEDQYTET